MRMPRAPGLPGGMRSLSFLAGSGLSTTGPHAMSGVHTQTFDAHVSTVQRFPSSHSASAVHGWSACTPAAAMATNKNATAKLRILLPPGERVERWGTARRGPYASAPARCNKIPRRAAARARDSAQPRVLADASQEIDHQRGHPFALDVEGDDVPAALEHVRFEPRAGEPPAQVIHHGDRHRAVATAVQREGGRPHATEGSVGGPAEREQLLERAPWDGLVRRARGTGHRIG